MILNEYITVSSKLDDPLYIKLNYNKILDKHNIYLMLSSSELKDNNLCVQIEISFVLNEDNKFVLNCINSKEVKNTENIKMLENSLYEDVKSGEYKIDDINNVLSKIIEHINQVKNKYNENINIEEDDLRSNISFFKDNYSINTNDPLIKKYRIKQKTIDNEIQDFLKILINEKTNIKNNIVILTTELLNFIKTLDVNLDDVNKIMLSNFVKFLKCNDLYTEDIEDFLNDCIPEIIKLVNNIDKRICDGVCSSSCFPCCFM